MTRRFAFLTVMVGAALVVACPADIKCWAGSARRGDDCSCPDGTLASSNDCIPLDSGTTALAPIDASDHDAGTLAMDAAPLPFPGVPMSPTAEANGGATPAPRPPGPSQADASPVGPTETVPPAPAAPTPAEQCLKTCAQGRCDNDGRCVPIPPTCGNRIVEAGEACDDGNDNPYDQCVSCQRARCGDGFIQPNAPVPEDCEANSNSPGFEAGSRALPHIGLWTEATCSFSTCQRKIYTTCRNHDECPPASGGCVWGVCAPASCPPEWPDCPFPPCPELPGYSYRDVGVWCYLACDPVEAKCPRGMRCDVWEEGGPYVCIGADEPPRT